MKKLLLLLILFLYFTSLQAQTGAPCYGISTIAGNGYYNSVYDEGGYSGDGGAATSAELNDPWGIAVDASGNVYIADEGNNRIRKVTVATGIITTIAGNGTGAYSGDGGAATSAELSIPQGVAVDASGNVYIADANNNRIRKVTAGTGIISTIAGNGTGAYSGDGGAATSAELNNPTGVAVDASGNVYIADFWNNRIRKVTTSTGIISTIAGNGTAGYSGDGGAASSAELNDPQGVAVDASGNVYIADEGNNRIRVVAAATGIISTIAGNGTEGYSGDGGAASSAELNGALGVAIDASGNVYIVDQNNERIRKLVSAAPTITTAGNATTFCASGLLTASSSATGLTYQWSNSSGAISGATNSTYTSTSSSSYTLTVSLSACSAASAATSITINALPTVSITNPASVCWPSTVNLTAASVTSGSTSGLSYTYWTNSGATVPLSGPSVVASSGTYYIEGTNTVTRCYSIQPVTVTVNTALASDISTIAGNGTAGYSGDGGAASSAELYLPQGVAVDASGNVYIADYDNSRIRMVTASTGIITTIAGNGTAGYSGDGVVATSVELNGPIGVAIDASGNVYIGDYYNNRIRKVTAGTGIISTIAGNGTQGYSGDGGAASAAELDFPAGVAVDVSGNVYIADYENNRIRMVAAGTGIISTIAGNGTGSYFGDGGAANSAELNSPRGVAVDASGNIYIADTYNKRIRKLVSAAPAITTAGNAATFCGSGLLTASSSATGLTYQWSNSSGPVSGATNSTYIATSSSNYKVTISLSGCSSSSAANSITINALPTVSITNPASVCSPSTVNLTAASVTSGSTSGLSYTYWTNSGATVPLNGPSTVASSGTYYIEGANTVTGCYSIQPVTVTANTALTVSEISTIAGNGTAGYSGDGGAASSAELNESQEVAVDASGNVYIADTYNNRIRMVAAGTGIISTIAGNGAQGYSGDGGAASAAELNLPQGVAVDASGNVYIADDNNRIRKVAAGTGIISTIAGNGTAGYSGDGGAATSAELNEPTEIAVDASGNLYIVDYENNRIRMVAAGTGIITTIAGNGTVGYSGDGGAASSAELNEPLGVAVDASGNVYIADAINNRIRMVAAGTGIITTIAGNGTKGYSGDGGAATSAELNEPTGVAVDASGNVYIADFGNNRIRMVTAGTGIINTIAGNGTEGYSGDGGSAASAELYFPSGVTVDASGNVYIVDYDNNRIRKVSAVAVTTAGNATTFCGSGLLTATSSATGVTYQWSNSSGAISGATNSTYTATSSDSYKVTISISGCSATSAATFITINATPALPTISTGSATTFCSGDSVTLTANSATSGVTYQWYRGGVSISGATGSTYSATTTGSYTVIAISASPASCLSAASVAASVTANAAPSAPTTTSPITYCQGDTSSPLTATGTSLKWYTVPTSGTSSTSAPTPSTNVTGTTSYYVSQTLNGCESPRGAVTVTINALPSAPTVGSPVIFCKNSTASVLTATGISLKWYTVPTSGTSSTSAPTPSTNATGTTSYYVSQTLNGCESPRDTITVVVNSLPIASITPTSTTYCQSETVPLYSNTGKKLTYQWNNTSGAISGATNSLYEAGIADTYTITITDSNNCSNTSAATNVTELTASITPSGPITICPNGNKLLDANTGTDLSYQWNNSSGAISGATSSSCTVSMAGTYTVIVTNSNNCSDTSAGIVISVSVPIATITAAGSTTVCAGNNLTLNANTGKGLTYQWNNASGSISGATSASYKASITGTYTVEVTNSNNCTDTSQAVNVTVSLPPAVTIASASSGDTSICSGQGLVLSIHNIDTIAYTYIWYLNGIQIANTENDSVYTPVTDGSYTVVIKNEAYECTTTSSVFHIGASPNVPVIDSSGVPPAITLTCSTKVTPEKYQWYADGKEIVGANSSTYAPLYNATYNVAASYKFSTENYCRLYSLPYNETAQQYNLRQMSFFTNDSSIIIPTSFPVTSFEVFPNPAKDKLNVTYSGGSSITIKLYNILGEVVLSTQQSNATGNYKLELPLISCSSGMYVLTLNDENSILTKKIVVE